VVGTRYTGDVDRVWREIGRGARRFHQVEALGFGEHLGGPVGESPDTTLAGWVDGWDEPIFGTGRLVDHGLLSRRAFDRARAVLSQMRHWPGEPRLCHGNLSLSNVLVDGDDVFIIDWGTAAGHLTPQLDLAELHVWSAEPQPPGLKAFLIGYELSAREHAAMAESLDVLQLWRVLSSAQWLLETDRARPGTIEFLGQKARALVARQERARSA
jgi:aminoglycoside phosphotransferase (APT) family kinase protein